MRHPPLVTPHLHFGGRIRILGHETRGQREPHQSDEDPSSGARPSPLPAVSNHGISFLGDRRERPLFRPTLRRRRRAPPWLPTLCGIDEENRRRVSGPSRRVERAGGVPPVSPVRGGVAEREEGFVQLARGVERRSANSRMRWRKASWRRLWKRLASHTTQIVLVGCCGERER